MPNLLTYTKRTRLHLLALITLPLLFSACGKKEVAPPPPQARPVTAVTATTRDVPLYMDTLGAASAYESVNIVSQVNGQIVSSPFTQGSMVKKGDLLFQIYKPPYEAALLQARGALAQAEAQLEINQLNLDRSRPLVPQKLISEQDFQALQATVKENLAAVESARGQVLAAEVNLGFTDIRSPIDGMVGVYNVNIGNVVTAASGTILTTVQRMDPIYIDFILPLPKFAEMRQYFLEHNKELTIRARYITDPSKNREAPMTIIGNEVNTSSGTVNLRADMPNSDSLFWPNQPVSVRLYLSVIKDAVLVPQACVQTGQQGRFVFIIKPDNTVEQVSVEVGQLQDDKTIVVTKGLSKGDKVVLDGQLYLRSGSRVSISELDGKPVNQPAASSSDKS